MYARIVIEKSSKQRSVAILCAFFLFVLCPFVFADTFDDIRVFKISGQDQRAVVKTPDGKLKVIKVGDALDKKLNVMEISDGRVVIEETKGHEIETIIIRLEDGKQKVQRLKKSGGPKPALLAPSAQGGKSNGK